MYHTSAGAATACNRGNADVAKPVWCDNPMVITSILRDGAPTTPYLGQAVELQHGAQGCRWVCWADHEVPWAVCATYVKGGRVRPSR